MDNDTRWVLGRGPWPDVLLWLGYGLLNHLVFAPTRFAPGNLLISGVLLVGQAIATYVHLRYLLAPRLDGRLSLLPYLGGLVLVVAGACTGLLGTMYLIFSGLLDSGFGSEDFGQFSSYWFGPIMGGVGMTLAITAGLYLYGRSRNQEKREADLTAEKREAELAYLRGQLNPHFLFNALNAIYVLIPRDPDGAQTALGGFSDLLRYQLYQTDGGLVPVDDELGNLAKYAALNQLRLEEDFRYEFNAPTGKVTGMMPPMLLLPLLENAFKYSPSLGGFIGGEARVGGKRFHLTLVNNIAEHTTTDPAASGIGLANIRRRLDLLFPNDHTFEAVRDSATNTFTATLEIPLQ